MKKLVWFFLLLSSLNLSAQEFGGAVLSNFEKEFYSNPQATLLDYEFVDSHPLSLMGEFLQVFVVEAKSMDKTTSSKKALVISHSPRREFIGKYDYIDADEIDELINALEYYINNLAGTKPKNHQSFIWTSRGGYQMQATCSMDFPKKYNLSSRIDAFDSSTLGALMFNKQVEKLIVTLKGARVMINAE